MKTERRGYSYGQVRRAQWLIAPLRGIVSTIELLKPTLTAQCAALIALRPGAICHFNPRLVQYHELSGPLQPIFSPAAAHSA
jgi:hypothetical protein